MRFTVTWHPSATDELTEIWLRATDRAAVTGAADTVDRLLAEDPSPKAKSSMGIGCWLLPL